MYYTFMSCKELLCPSELERETIGPYTKRMVCPQCHRRVHITAQEVTFPEAQKAPRSPFYQDHEERNSG